MGFQAIFFAACLTFPSDDTVNVLDLEPVEKLNPGFTLLWSGLNIQQPPARGRVLLVGIKPMVVMKVNYGS